MCSLEPGSKLVVSADKLATEGGVNGGRHHLLAWLKVKVVATVAIHLLTTRAREGKSLQKPVQDHEQGLHTTSCMLSPWRLRSRHPQRAVAWPRGCECSQCPYNAHSSGCQGSRAEGGVAWLTPSNIHCGDHRNGAKLEGVQRGGDV